MEVGSASSAGVGRPPQPAKRGRGAAAQGGGRPPRCQVEGCQADLSGVKAYYSKHKVCGVHSKSPIAIVAGLEQRFCQQCSRFHQLGEFDQAKRSCRRRLADHNERRRKPPLPPIFSQCYGINGKRGSFLMDFTPYPYPWDGQTVASGQCLQQAWHCGEGSVGFSQSTSALSLLSNQPLDFGVNSDGARDDVHQSSTNPSMINGFSSPWELKGNQDNASSPLFTLMLPQTTSGSSGDIPTGSHCSGDLEMGGRDTGRGNMGIEYSGYDSSVQNLHWTL
ncbi:unnamed protein product [Cuscuta campestris]|nr:unnamed protein product [Cuscuta campestris]